jgi:Uma2 family endonuclease
VSAAEKIPRVSYEQFLLLLELSHTKLEWLDGIAYAMAGGSFEHSRLASQIGALFTNALSGKPCVVLQSDMLVKAPGDGFAAFPDVSVVCGDPLLVTHERNPALTNPTTIVEVLSPTTDDFDRGEKFERYKTIPSLAEYVLVSQDTKRIEVFARKNGWSRESAGAGETLEISSIGVSLRVDDLYFNPLAREKP